MLMGTLDDYKNELDWSDLGFEIYTFIMIVGKNMQLRPYQIADILFMAKEVWQYRQELFGTNTAYEYIILGLTLLAGDMSHTMFDVDNSPLEVSGFVEALDKKNYERNLKIVYRCYGIAKDVLAAREHN